MIIGKIEIDLAELLSKKPPEENYKRKEPLFVRFQIPGTKDAMLIESRHLQRAIDELYKGHKPDSKAAKVITHNLQQVLREEEIYNHPNYKKQFK